MKEPTNTELREITLSSVLSFINAQPANRKVNLNEGNLQLYKTGCVLAHYMQANMQKFGSCGFFTCKQICKNSAVVDFPLSVADIAVSLSAMI